MDTCTEQGCDGPIDSKGLCKKHYMSKWRAENPRYVVGTNKRQKTGPRVRLKANPKTDPKLCSADGCERFAETKGMCKMHYARSRRTPVRTPEIIRFRDELGRKQCIGCPEWKPESEFYKKGDTRDGLQPRCIACYRDWQKQNRAGKGGTWVQEHRRKKREALMELQGGECRICTRDLAGAVTAIDHDHACHPGTWWCTECVRGLLCMGCNLGLGGFKDDVGSLYRAIEYLEDHQRSTIMTRAS